MNIGSNGHNDVKTKGSHSVSSDDSFSYIDKVKSNVTTPTKSGDHIGIQFPQDGVEYEKSNSIPTNLFDFNLVIDSRQFKITMDTLLNIRKEEDLTDYSEDMLNDALDKCSSYRLTCFCAHIAAHKEKRRSMEDLNDWLAGRRDEAREAIIAVRAKQKLDKIRKDIGQITKDDLEDWIRNNHGADFHAYTTELSTWKDNEKIYLEMRDTLKDRGTHLQTLLKRVTDQTGVRKGDSNDKAY